MEKDDIVFGNVSFREMENACESRFFSAGECWHITTPGEDSELFFTCDRDYVQAMNLMGLCADRFYGKIRIYTFELMSNHLHIAISGAIQDCKAFYNLFTKRLRTYFSILKRPIAPAFLKPEYISVQTLSHLRHLIIYVNRNGYVYNKWYCPYSYPWGGNIYFYTPFLSRMEDGRFVDISGRRRKEFLRSEDVAASDRLRYMNLEFFNGQCVEFAQKEPPMESILETDAGSKPGMLILPSSYCYIKEAQGFFRGVQHYFYMIERDQEISNPVLRLEGDHLYMTDHEVLGFLFPVMKERYDTVRIASLSLDQKRDMATLLYYKKKCGSVQIRRILGLKSEYYDKWFPVAK